MFNVKYIYEILTDGCGCCQYTEHTLTVYGDDGEEEWSMTHPDRCHDDADVTKFMQEYLPEFPDFTVSSYSRY